MGKDSTSVRLQSTWGVTLDGQLTFKQYIENTVAKLKTRNVIHKSAASTWGSAMSILKTSALVLVYSAAEYASPVWLNSSHYSKIDVQLNHSMRMDLWYYQINTDRTATGYLPHYTTKY